MAASKEVLSKNKTRLIPPFGTPEYFEYLRDFQPSDEHLSNPKQFMAETMAGTSLAIMIRRNRTYWPLRNLQTADMDSRFFNEAPKRPIFFRGSVGVRTNLPNPNQVRLHAQHPIRSYDLAIPVTDTYLYDPTWHIYAAYFHSGSSPMVYNEMANASNYEHEHDAQVLFDVIREAASDSIDILHHIHGPIDDFEYPEIAVAWAADYLNDDPNEFMPRASRVQNVLERLRQINMPRQPDYLKDDPDEFLAAS